MIARRVAVAALVTLARTAFAEPDLPRLAGLVIAPGEHVALLDVGTGTLLQVSAGDEVAGFRIRSVEREGVRLERGPIVRLLQPSPAAAPRQPVDSGGATFGLVLRPQPPVDD